MIAYQPEPGALLTLTAGQLRAEVQAAFDAYWQDMERNGTEENDAAQDAIDGLMRGMDAYEVYE